MLSAFVSKFAYAVDTQQLSSRIVKHKRECFQFDLFKRNTLWNEIPLGRELGRLLLAASITMVQKPDLYLTTTA